MAVPGDVVLTQALSRYGKLVSSIKKIPIGHVSPLLKRVVSFRRSVYMVVNNDADLDLVLNFRVDDFDYVVFITTDKIKCFGCGNIGHLVRACPSKQVEEDNRSADAEGAANGTVQTAGVTGEAGEAERNQQGRGRVILMELKALGLRRMLWFQ